MADETEKKVGTVQVPGLQPVPWVAVKLPDGTIALRHPDELEKEAPARAAKGEI